MRAALGLALVAGGALLVVMALHGRTPFDPTSGSSGRAAQPGASDPAVRSGSSEIVSRLDRFGGTP